MSGRSGRKLSATAVPRFFRKEVEKAIETLEEPGPLSDADIHSVRKRVKRMRAALRLVRKAIGAGRYRRENESCRDAARPLSQVRDSRILIDALERVARRTGPPERAAIEHVRETLVRSQTRARARMRRERKSVLATLRRERKQAARWPALDRWGVLQRGIERIYGAGRDGLELAAERPSAAARHEWRKQVKYLWHQLEVVQPMRPALIARLARETHALSDQLGDDHDLALLAQRVERMEGRLPDRARKRILNVIEERRRALQSSALKLGRRVYRQTPQEFVARLVD